MFFFFQAEDGIRDSSVTGVQTCALPITGYDHRVGRGRLAEEKGGGVGGGFRSGHADGSAEVGERLGSPSLILGGPCGRIFLPIWPPTIPLSNIWPRPRLAKKASLPFLSSFGKTLDWGLARLSPCYVLGMASSLCRSNNASSVCARRSARS